MTASTIGEDGEVVVECGLDAPAERVWRALTVPELAADWLGAVPAADNSANDGAADRTSEANRPAGPPATFEIVDARPFSRLTYRWRDRTLDGPSESFVTVEISPRGPRNTWFRLTHRPPRMWLEAANGNTPMALAA